MRRQLALISLAALVVCPAALAHGGKPGYTSTVQRVTPAAAGVTLTVLGGDDRLELTNQSAHEIIIEGYDNEPYLRFTQDGVYQNTRSPATYLNDDRYGNVELPAQADAQAPANWELVTPRDHYDWHDHRIHWMSPIDPPQVRDQPEQSHHVFNWTVAATIDGQPLTIAGTLDYAPIDGGRPAWIYLALPVAALALAGGALAYIRTRQRQPSQKPR